MPIVRRDPSSALPDLGLDHRRAGERLPGVPATLKPPPTSGSAQAGVVRGGEAERAAQLAEAALERCIFLGDSLEVPERVEILHMRGSAHELGSLTWFVPAG